MPRLRVVGVAVVTLCLFVGLFATANAAPVDRGGGPASRAGVSEKFIGTWRLKWAVTRDQAGNTNPIFDVGKLTYTAQGDVWAFVGNRRQPGAWYTGTFDVRPRTHTVVHHIQYSSTPSQNGTSGPRGYHFRGDSLKLTDPLAPGIVVVGLWKRV
jgi:hypothetical protein